MATPFPADHPFLSRGFEPLRLEGDCADLIVEGEMPNELLGCLYRIGPNPQYAPRGVYNPLLADGMIHAFNFQQGKVSYRNRWVRTQQWLRERAAGRALFGTSGNPRDADPQVAGLQTDGVANTNLVWHGGRLLALEEGHAPIEIDAVSLDTRGVWTFAGQLPGNMTAHPKIDPHSTEMLFFANFPGRDFSGALDLYVADTLGHLARQERIQGPFAALVHDFAITRDHVVFIVCPLTLSLERLRAGGAPIAWEPERQTWLGVVPRCAGKPDVSWIPMPARMVWHTVNAYSADGEIVIDVCEQEAPGFASADGAIAEPGRMQQFLTRWRIEWPNGRAVSTERLTEVVGEYPRVDERFCGQEYQYAYLACCGGPGTGDLFHRAIGRFDHATKQMELHHFGNRRAVSEPIFVPRSAASEEGCGYLLVVVYDELSNASDLAVLDAERIENGPVACARLDHRVPMGFHGTWVPG